MTELGSYNRDFTTETIYGPKRSLKYLLLGLRQEMMANVWWRLNTHHDVTGNSDLMPPGTDTLFIIIVIFLQVPQLKKELFSFIDKGQELCADYSENTFTEYKKK